MGSWADSEQGQKVVEGVPASYYGTFQGQQSQSGTYPPQQSGTYPPQQSGAYPPQQSGTYPPQQYSETPSAPGYPQSGGRVSYPVISDNQGRYQDYSRPAWGTQQYQQSGRLPFCNLGYGWFLFILGFFLVVPWYVGAIMLFCLAHDERERGGLVACTVASVVVLLVGGSRHMYHRY